MHRGETSGKDDQERVDDQTGSSDPQPPQLVTFDAILPPTMALRAEETDVKRINRSNNAVLCNRINADRSARAHYLN